jgi:DnaJ-class molecular chaperone
MLNPDLYEILKVDKKATSEEIHSSYKKIAKKVHPDMENGNKDKFALVKRAHDILMNKERRDKYDATGDDSEVTPDNTFSGTMNIISFMFNTVLQECAQSGTYPLEIDIINRIKSLIERSINDSDKNLRIAREMMKTDKKLHGRFIRKKKKEDRNIFVDIINFRVSTMQQNINTLEINKKSAKEALDIIKDFEYKSDSSSRSETNSPFNFIMNIS